MIPNENQKVVVAEIKQQFEHMPFLNSKQREIVADLIEQLEYTNFIEMLNDFAVCKLRLEVAEKRPPKLVK